MPNTYNTLQTAHVHQTFRLDTVHDQREASRPDADTGLLLTARAPGIVALQRVVQVIAEDGQELAVRVHRFQDSRLRGLSHAALNRRMQRDTRRLATQYGSRFQSLPITTDWASARAITPEDGPLTIEHDVHARHVPLYHMAGQLFSEANRTDTDAQNDHRVFIDTDATHLPLDRHDLILLGNGRGTAETPDWTAFNDIVADARQNLDAGYRHGHSIMALLADAHASLRQAISSQT